MKIRQPSSFRSLPLWWRQILTAVQFVAFALLTASSASPDLHEVLFHTGHGHAHGESAAGPLDDGASSSDGESSSHPCSLCVWGHGGFAAAAPTGHALPKPDTSENLTPDYATAEQVPGRASGRAHAIRGPPEFSS